VSANRWLRGLWIVTAGAGIALSAGHGVAAAESDSAGADPASSSAPSDAGAEAPSGATATGTKDVGKDHDSGSTGEGEPTSTVSANTVTVDRDDPVAVIGSVVKVKPAKTNTKTSKSEVTAPTAPVTGSAPDDLTPTDPVAADAPSAVETTPIVDSKPPVVTEGTSDPVVVATPVASTPPTDVKPAGADKPAPATLVANDVSAVRSLAAPAAPRAPPGPLATVVISLLSAFGLLPPVAPVPVDVTGTPAVPVPGTSANAGVTGVKVGSSNLTIPVGSGSYTGAADWYFPTQADGSVKAQGVMLLQHGFLGSKSWYSALAKDLARQTNSVVVVPNVPSFGFFTCAGCTLSSVSMQRGVADLFIDPNRTSLNASAAAAGYHGVLPDEFVLTGHSAGGGLAAAAGGFYSDAVKPEDDDLLGVVMYDGVSSNGTFAGALKSLDTRGTPIYQVAAPPQPWNANGRTTKDLVTLRPGQFVGVVLANGSHVDSLIGGSPIVDFFSQLVIKRSPAGNTQAVYTLANGWINDMYAGLGPTTGTYGTYGDPGQIIDLAPATAVVLGPKPVLVVGDPGGNTEFLLSRTRTVSPGQYRELLDRASVDGVKGRITVTPQPAAVRELSSPNRV